MDDGLLEILLREEEGATLDFKEEQYPFKKQLDDVKSELLKDILAFANSWRRTDAYILIGVKEVKGKRSVPVGVSEHLEDANLQEFVNSKTNRPIPFRYEAYQYDGVQLGIITIEQPERPVCLTRNYGRLHKGVVYIRRSSGTVEASPEEIARMGELRTKRTKSHAILDLEFAVRATGERKGHEMRTKTVFLNPLDEKNIPSYESGYGLFRSPLQNRNYWRQMHEFVFCKNAFCRIEFALRNLSGSPATDVCGEVKIEKESVLLMDESSFPEEPSMSIILAAPLVDLNQDVHVEDKDKFWLSNLDFGKILPHQTLWTRSCIYLCANSSREIIFDVTLYCSESSKIKIPLKICLDVEPREMTLKDIGLDKA